MIFKSPMVLYFLTERQTDQHMYYSKVVMLLLATPEDVCSALELRIRKRFKGLESTTMEASIIMNGPLQVGI
jgi:hypothetical protein